MGFDLTINGRRVRVEDAAPTTTLLEFLRSSGLTGSKQGCAEGDCGACTVAIVERDAAGNPTYRGINSCIALLPMFADREIVTVEGLAGDASALHPVQAAMVDHYGSQCGYCTPGFVMALFEGYYRRDCKGPSDLSDQLCGNLCRCTGYRPIRDAALDSLKLRDASLGSSGAARSDPFRQRLGTPVAKAPFLDYEVGAEHFVRPVSLAGLFAALAGHPEARLVAGATEIGVDVTKKSKSFPLLVSTDCVAELTGIAKTASAWRIGGAATLTAVEEAVGDEYPSFLKMLKVFAARQIRNRATLGGNLATASPIGDSAPVLLSLDAELVLASAGGSRTVPLSEFFTAYRKTLLGPGEIILEIVLPRLDPSSGLCRRSDFLKVSKRRELDISIVAAAFSVDTDPAGIVRRARLAYGGVAPTPVRARRAEAALEGRRFGEAAAEAAAVLAGEFRPIDDVRGGASYRRGLIVSLWEKFVSGETSAAQDGAPDFEKGSDAVPADASRALRHESAVGHVTGRALYADDTAQRRPMLDVWPVCSPHARARILRRDASRARSAPGVVAVLMAEDIPGLNNVGTHHDEPLFADDEVKYHGQVVAIVVGRSLRACRAAAAAVDVEYEALPPLLGIREAIAKGSFHTPPHTIARGDWKAALEESPLKLEGEFSVGGQEHFYLETQAAWAEAGEGGSVFVSSSTQHPTEIQAIVAELIGQPRNKVVVQSPRMGGGFGGKETQGNAFAAMVALASIKTRQPVRIQLDRDLDMMITGKRHPFLARFSAGYDRRGMILAAAVDLYSDGGWSLDLSQPVLDRALFHVDNGYYVPALRVTGLIARTNVASNTAFRGFGGPQGMLVMEEIVDRIARRLGLAPEDVRGRNLYRGKGETNTTHFLQEIGDNRLQTVWRRVQRESGFAKKRREVDRWNRAHPRIKRGLAVTPVKFGISFTLTHYNQAGALVLLYTDGTAQVNHGGTEMGQGLHTKIHGIAMRELGLPASRVRVMPTTTDKVPNTSATAASSGADLNGAAVRNACATLRERLLPVAAALLSKKAGKAVPESRIRFLDGKVAVRGSRVALDMADVCRRAHELRISMAVSGFYATPGIHWNWSTSSGRPFQYFVCGAAVAEVEVDGYSGMHRVVRIDAVHDVGDSLNPGVDLGQIEGGIVQGIGWLTREELLWDREGRLTTHSASTYQIPAISDAPVEMHVTLLPMAAQEGTIHGSKASGEPPLMLAFSVREAIRDAVAAFGTRGGEVPLPSPATSEAIFSSIRQRLAAETAGATAS
ncbi:MAG TPA: xanthine dehydrogenase molybdopterin binding subunit [Opitutaceae bacterium]|nr:xanthine dehydrogenase molybdopterin binding subunit [Opitutaceae bacterium]